MTAPRAGGRRVLLAVVALIGANLLWAGNYAFSPIAIAELSPTGLAAWRWLVSAPVLLGLALVVDRPRWGEVLRRWPTHLGQSLLGFAGFSLFTYLAVEQISPVNAALVQTLNPGLILLLTGLATRLAPTRREVLGIGVSLVGVLIVLLGPGADLANPGSTGLGMLWMTGAVVAWGFYTVNGRRQLDPPITGTAMQAVIAALVTTPIAAATGGMRVVLSAPALASVGYIALGASVAAMILWNFGVTRVGPNAAGASLNLLPVFTAGIAAVLGAPLVPVQLVGGLLVLVGMWLVTRRPGRPPAPPDPPPAGVA